MVGEGDGFTRSAYCDRAMLVWSAGITSDFARTTALMSIAAESDSTAAGDSKGKDQARLRSSSTMWIQLCCFAYRVSVQST